ncbi:dynamin family protein [Exiguobacterium antarcticum]|uniref:dynamin family protein n=1 Tax=Exiguobacterium antarcticum TaxID=132920 RepID=UPI000285E5D2|nr:dynamin family protein [Exiguobacterium antarcticum]AFS70648.1 Dynamin family protein [Exiguobacterium antarcticum B7]
MRSFEERLTNHIEATALLTTLIQPASDQLRLNKLDKFSTKLLKREFTIAFAGHFSAGKSSMINALTGESILPTSPIPTSANIVTLQQDQQDAAIVHFHDRPSVKLAPADLPHLETLGRDGTVERIDITHAGSTLPNGLVLMDTPGVDSVDDAHRISTESALHLADLIFYVMDYNHVQSELNFTVTRELLASVPELYLIVNQIDKHQSTELSFEDFKRSVFQSFVAHGVEPKGIFFTSLRDIAHPENEFATVKQLVEQSIRDVQPKLLQSATTTLEALHAEHVAYLEMRIEEAEQAVQEQLTPADQRNQEALFSDMQQVEQQIRLMSPEQWVSRFSQHRESLLRNATLMPFELREKMTRFLESRQTSFKVGFFRSTKKTQATQQQLADELLRAYQSVATSEISLHLRKLMKQSLSEAGCLSDQHAMSIDHYPLDPPLRVVEDALQEGITITGESVLQFTNRVVSNTSAWYVKETNQWRDAIRTELEQMDGTVLQDLRNKQDMLRQKCELLTVERESRHMLKTYLEQADAPTSTQLDAAHHQLVTWRQALIEAEQTLVPFTPIDREQEVAVTAEAPVSNNVKQERTYSLEEIEQIQTILSGVTGFEETVAYLKDKLARVSSSTFTIALFGAFSAGKSSFCNALLGQAVLPVSPNPTTASINRINPVSSHHPHGTAIITFKSEQNLVEELNDALRVFDTSITSLSEAVTWIQAQPAQRLRDVSILRAFLTGYPSVHPFIGTTQTVDQKTFTDYVAKEHLSCFVDVIDLYFDSPLTRLGITLVDTPGADSINARHTDVAFEYIKDADAILFVTYFNHAFARADREFLIQLGRVKDAFELDKMFFIVNAIDLAQNESEKQDVLHYVGTELQRFGIRAPRLFGVSSLQALAEKQMGHDHQSGLPSFETAFHQFLEQDLKGLAVQALSDETEKTVHRLQQLIEQTEFNIARKETRLDELDVLANTIETHFIDRRADLLRHALFAEIHELLHHVNQRIYYRFPDFFKEAYHPVRFANATKQHALQEALLELLGFLKYDFEQELRVTHFRIDGWIKSALEQRFQEEEAYATKLNPSFQLSPFEPISMPTIPFAGPFQDAAPYQSVKQYFRNAKAFFERNEKEQLKEALVQLTKPDATAYLESEEQRLRELAHHHVLDLLDGMYEALRDTLQKQVDMERHSLTTTSPLEQFQQARSRILQATRS